MNVPWKEGNKKNGPWKDPSSAPSLLASALKGAASSCNSPYYIRLLWINIYIHAGLSRATLEISARISSEFPL